MPPGCSGIASVRLLSLLNKLGFVRATGDIADLATRGASRWGMWNATYIIPAGLLTSHTSKATI
jgi:hypothetical protein